MPRKKRKPKLPNGFGSIVHLSKRRGRERLSPRLVRLPTYYDSDGKAHRKILGCYKTYEDAFNALAQFEGKLPKEHKLYDVYEMRKKGKYYKKLTPQSQERYDRSFSRFDRLHSKRIADIKLYQLQNIIDEMATEGYIKDGEELGYTAEYISRLKTVIKKVYTEAIKNDMVDKNLGDFLEVDGRESIPEKQVFKDKSIEIMFENIERVPFVRYILLMIYTGMRPGEFRGLKVNSIDLEKGVIKDFGIKTDRGKEREILILPKIKDIVTQLVEESKTGYIYERNGQRVSETTFYEDYYATLEELGLPLYLPKACRSTFATMAHTSKVNELVIQMMLGHESYKTTTESYIKAPDEFMRTELNKIS